MRAAIVIFSKSKDVANGFVAGVWLQGWKGSMYMNLGVALSSSIFSQQASYYARHFYKWAGWPGILIIAT